MITERKAVLRLNEVVAECPLDAVCSAKVEKTKKHRFCGHFGGSIKDRRGYRVFCNFAGKKK